MKEGKMSETKKLNIHAKLALIQRELKAPKNQRNNFGNYNYRSCEDILEGFKDVVKRFPEELGDVYVTAQDEMVHLPSQHEPHFYESKTSKGELVHNIVDFDRYYIKATVALCDSEGKIENVAFARESLDKKGMDDSQVTGATSSYARKYAFNGLFAIDDTQDADTMDNSQKGKNTVNKTTTKKAPAKSNPQDNGTPQASETKPASASQLAWVDKRLKANKFEDYKPEELKFISSATASKIIQNKIDIDKVIATIKQRREAK